ncbi:MAG: N-6 DNA methylase [Verrucomicrobiae bacterium]|nr:N-6 DNA methylase [Verrucomicrobiae bacterium]
MTRLTQPQHETYFCSATVLWPHGVLFRSRKPKARRGKILFINAVNEVTLERAQSFITDDHLRCVVRAYRDFKDEPGFTHVVPIEEIRAKEGNLGIFPLYVGGETQVQTDEATQLATEALAMRLDNSTEVRNRLRPLLTSSFGADPLL